MWARLRVDAATAAAGGPILASFLNAAVLRHSRIAPHVLSLSQPLATVAPPALRDGFQTKARSLQNSWKGAGY